MSETYSELCQISKLEFSVKRIKLKAVNYFRKMLHLSMYVENKIVAKAIFYFKLIPTIRCSVFNNIIAKSSRSEMFCKKKCYQEFQKSQWETTVLETSFNKVTGCKPTTLINTIAQVFSYKICGMYHNSYSVEYLKTATSVLQKRFLNLILRKASLKCLTGEGCPVTRERVEGSGSTSMKILYCTFSLLSLIMSL